jgi:hypothetical protein
MEFPRVAYIGRIGKVNIYEFSAVWKPDQHKSSIVLKDAAQLKA